MKKSWRSKGLVGLELWEEVVLKDLIEIEINALLADSLHQVCIHPLVKPTHALLPPRPRCQLANRVVFLAAGAPDVLVLLDAGPQRGDGVGEEHREYFAESTAEKVPLAEGSFGESELVV